MVAYVLDMLFPPLCSGCNLELAALCADCRPQTRDARTLPLAGLTVLAAGQYAGSLRRAILAFKHGRRDVGFALADLLAERTGSLPPEVVLVPVPTTARRRGERGFDQSALLASRVARQQGVRSLEALRQQAGDAQRGRSRIERLGARGRFACTEREKVADARIVLVDDVVTTGATLADCARAIRAHGASVEKALVLAYA